MKNLIYLILIFNSLMFSNILLAQDDLQVIHKSNNKNSGGNFIDSKNSAYFNIGQLARGGISIGYQRRVALGFTPYLELGLIASDYIGRVDFFNEVVYQSDLSSVGHDDIDYGRMFNIGMKYYYQQQMQGGYVAFEYGNVSITAKRTIQTSNYINYLNGDIVNLPYNSNEYKILFGTSSSTDDSKLFADINIGFGVRKISFRDFVEENTYYYTSSYSSQYIQKITIKQYDKLKLWMFFNLKFGYQF